MAVSNVTIETTGDYSIALGHVNLTGAITNNGNLALTDANIADGTTITNNGNLTLGTVTNNGMASLNGNITLSGTITDNGSFNLANAQVNILSLDGFTRDESAAATYTGGQVEGNGFEQSTYIVITGSGTENKSLEVSYDGRTQNLQDGKLMGQTYGTFHVNSDTESVFYIASAAPEGHDTSTISMAGGTTLTVDAALGGRDIAVNGAATADIQSGQSLSASSVNVSAEGSSLTLTGNGSYYAGQDSSRNVYLHAAGREKVALGADWTGEVIVEGMTNTNYLDLNNLGHQGSTVTLKGSTGYLKQANNGNVARFTADLQLVNADNGTAAYTVINGNSGSGGTDPGNHYIFEGAVKGTGDFVYDHSLGSETIRNRQTFEFAGDVSEWTGKLENLEGLSTFRFKEDATEVNINTIQVRTNGANNKMDLEFAHDRAATVNSVIQKAEDAGSSEIHLAVQNTSAEGTTFTKSVSADTLTVGDNTKASFNGATSAGTLETGAGSTLSGTVTVASTATINGSVENGGLQWAAGQSAQTFNLNTVYDVGNANVLTTIATGSTINFGETGMIELGTAGQDNTGLAGKSLTLTASFTLNEAVEGSILSTETLWLIKGTGIDASLVNFDASTATESGSSALTRYAWATSLEAEWVLPESTAELMRAATEPEAGAYRFVATDEGIGVQYYQNNVPEPTTATLSLLALAALAARRRR